VSTDRETRTPLKTGGCQCGAIRFATFAPPRRVGLCHCRMCQKAVGGPFGVYAIVPLSGFEWTTAQPSTWASSNIAVRDFCAACGTPLAYRHSGGDTIEILAGTFDDPTHVVPTYEVGREGKLAWVSTLHQMPGKTTSDNIGAQKLAAIVSYQHPDRE
jgi:hypothetical protein